MKGRTVIGLLILTLVMASCAPEMNHDAKSKLIMNNDDNLYSYERRMIEVEVNYLMSKLDSINDLKFNESFFNVDLKKEHLEIEVVEAYSKRFYENIYDFEPKGISPESNYKVIKTLSIEWDRALASSGLEIDEDFYFVDTLNGSLNLNLPLYPDILDSNTYVIVPSEVAFMVLRKVVY